MLRIRSGRNKSQRSKFLMKNGLLGAVSTKVSRLKDSNLPSLSQSSKLNQRNSKNDSPTFSLNFSISPDIFKLKAKRKEELMNVTGGVAER